MDFLKMGIACCTLAFLPQMTYGWQNGQSSNASTNILSECSNPPYSTHDWIADKALSILPNNQASWLRPHRTMYLLGTEAPDNDDIPTNCDSPNTGYDDRSSGHSVEWVSDLSGFAFRNGNPLNRAAVRAQEEYNKAVNAFRSGEISDAAFYLGAMAHYIGDVSQYGHSYPGESNHSNYEGWVGRRTKQLNNMVFEDYIAYDGPIRRRAFTAVKRISKVTFGGKGQILPTTTMDMMYRNQKDSQAYIDSVGFSLNMGINELSDVLFYFWVKEVQQ